MTLSDLYEKLYTQMEKAHGMPWENLIYDACQALEKAIRMEHNFDPAEHFYDVRNGECEAASDQRSER